jgi:ribonuclease HII
MAILVGIDEAGYGPILGPLVVSAAVVELPDVLLGKSLWETLRKSVAKMRAGAAGRVVINDSKKLHTGRDYGCLQRGVLASLAAAKMNPVQNVGELLTRLDSNIAGKLGGYPWYGGVKEWELKYDGDDVGTAGAALGQEMAEQGLRMVGLWSRVLPVGRFNEMVEAVDNKASVLFSLICQLVQQAYKRFGNQNLQIVIDKQSGRSHYRKPLQRMFPGTEMKVIQEDDMTSSYQLSGFDSSMKIHFLQKGDQRQLPIALASMTSKYVRELFMEMLNAYFQERFPAVKPTAGYYKDGKRFLSELEGKVDEELAPRHLLVRVR